MPNLEGAALLVGLVTREVSKWSFRLYTSQLKELKARKADALSWMKVAKCRADSSATSILMLDAKERSSCHVRMAFFKVTGSERLATSITEDLNADCSPTDAGRLGRDERCRGCSTRTAPRAPPQGPALKRHEPATKRLPLLGQQFEALHRS